MKFTLICAELIKIQGVKLSRTELFSFHNEFSRSEQLTFLLKFELGFIYIK